MGEDKGRELVEFEDCRVERTTDKAALIIVHGDQKVWISKSQIHDDSEIYFTDYESGDKGTLVIPRWLAEEKGLV